MDIVSLICFSILLLAWLVLPIKGTEAERESALGPVQKLLSSK